jgi:hypothetical protein
MLFAASQCSFWTSNWMEYNTGILRTNVGQFGVTEAEFTCLFIHLISGIFGQNVWEISISAIIPASVF